MAGTRDLHAEPRMRIDGYAADLVAIDWLGVGPDGTVALLQSQDHQVLFFDSAGSLAGRIGREGDGPGEFQTLVRGGWRSDTLWVSDPMLGRVTLLASPGTLVRTLPPVTAAHPLAADSGALPTFGFLFPYALYQGDSLPMEMVPLWGRQSLKSPEETLAETHRVGPPGVRYEYCNVCYSAAGYVIALTTGLSVDEYLATRIFVPLGVETTTPTRPTPQVVEHLALPYGSEDGVTVPIDLIRFNVFAAGDAYLRPKDMAAFLAGVLNLGTYRGHRILSEASAAELMRPQFGSDDAGLGFNIDALDGRTIVEKNGILPGYRIDMLGDPQTRDGAYVAANSTQAGRVVARLAQLALRLLWGENPPPLASFGPGG